MRLSYLIFHQIIINATYFRYSHLCLHYLNEVSKHLSLTCYIMTMTVPFTEENLLVEAVYVSYLFMYVLSSNRWEHLILTPSKGIPPPDLNDRTTIPTTNRNLNVIVVFPSLRFFPPLSLNPILVTVTPYYPKPLFPRCNSDKGCLRWRKARTYLGIPEHACETTESARRQPDHIH